MDKQFIKDTIELYRKNTEELKIGIEKNFNPYWEIVI